VLIGKRLLPETEKRDIYLQGSASFKLRKGHFTVSVYCSPRNPGARELAEELNSIWPGLLQIANVQSWSDLSTCDHMLVYLNARTWTHDPETFAAEVREAMRMGLHLQPCHEFSSVIDPGSARHALEFKEIMDVTPADLKKGPTNVYSQIAIALKGGELREPGLAVLAGRLAVRVARKPIESPLPSEEPTSEGPITNRIKSISRDMVIKLTSRSDVTGGVEHSSSFRDDVPSQMGSTTVIDDTPAASAAGVLTIESSV